MGGHCYSGTGKNQRDFEYDGRESDGEYAASGACSQINVDLPVRDRHQLGWPQSNKTISLFSNEKSK
jgi:hypothetical protein